MTITELEKEAIRWFNSHRPLTWSQEKHLENYSVNTTTDIEESLAKQIADFIKHRRRLI